MPDETALKKHVYCEKKIKIFRILRQTAPTMKTNGNRMESGLVNKPHELVVTR